MKSEYKFTQLYYLCISKRGIFLKKNIYVFYKNKSECTNTFQICLKMYFKNKKYATLIHGSKTGGMWTCIVICLLTVYAKIYTYFKTKNDYFSMYESPIAEIFLCILFVYISFKSYFMIEKCRSINKTSLRSIQINFI